jgi:hypothetical protein
MEDFKRWIIMQLNKIISSEELNECIEAMIENDKQINKK